MKSVQTRRATPGVLTHLLIAVLGLYCLAPLRAQQPGTLRPPDASRAEPRFQSGVDLIDVTATVTDANGRFVPGLTRDDFTVYEDDKPQTVTYFRAERVPVSLGLVIDTSGSMAGEKFDDARAAIERFVNDLLDDDDELFLYRFSDHPSLVQGWTEDHDQIARAMARIAPNGGTSLYDAVMESLPLAERGEHTKRALVVISDGNDTSSIADLTDVRTRIRNSEVIIYAVGIDGVNADTFRRQAPDPRVPQRTPPSPRPPFGRRPGGGGIPIFPQFGQGGGGRVPYRNEDRVNADALRGLTDESGGRTEIVRSVRDLNPATASIADELSKQYSLGYTSNTPHDGRWHTIRVETKHRSYRVRARRGYLAR
ncbi:MAG: VWA domain-containing protein [Vicinamibacterales bacterium]